MRKFITLIVMLAISAGAYAQIDEGTLMYTFENGEYTNQAANPDDSTGVVGVFQYDFDLDEAIEVTEPTFVEGVEGKALSVPENGYLRLMHGIDANGTDADGNPEDRWVNKWSIVVDVKFNHIGGDKPVSLFEANPAGAYLSDWTVKADGTIGSATDDVGFSSESLENDKWYRLAFVADLGNSIKIFVDGELFYTSANAPDFNGLFAPYSADNFNNADFRIGGHEVATAGYELDRVSVFDSTLADSKISDMGAVPQSSGDTEIADGTLLFDFAGENYDNMANQPDDSTGVRGVYQYDFELAEAIEITEPQFVSGIQDEALSIPENGYLLLMHGIDANGTDADGNPEDTWVNKWSIVVDVRFSHIGGDTPVSLFEANPGGAYLSDWTVKADGTIGTATDDVGFSSESLENDKWYRLAFVADLGNSIKIFVDGDLFYTSANTPNFNGLFAPYSANAFNNADFRIGGHEETTAAYELDQVAVFDYNLADSEVMNIGAAPAAPSNVPDIEEKEAIVKIYPNPATNYIRLAAEKAGHYKLFNMTGQIVKQGIVKTSAELGVSNLNAGMYMLRFTNKDNEQVTRKILVR